MGTVPNKLKHFNIQRFEAKNSVGVNRIFCLGRGETTYGRPYGDVVSFSGRLREYLPLADPTWR